MIIIIFLRGGGLLHNAKIDFDLVFKFVTLS